MVTSNKTSLRDVFEIDRFSAVFERNSFFDNFQETTSWVLNGTQTRMVILKDVAYNGT